MKVNTAFVLEGVVRAARNAKRFMEDAILLYEAERYGSAYIIGVLAIENVGRGRWMLQQILEATIDEKTKQFGVKTEIDGKTFRDNIRSKHETTIRTGTVSLQLRVVLHGINPRAPHVSRSTI